MFLVAPSTVKYTSHIKYYIKANKSIVLKVTNNEHKVLSCDHFSLCEHGMEEGVFQGWKNTLMICWQTPQYWDDATSTKMNPLSRKFRPQGGYLFHQPAQNAGKGLLQRRRRESENHHHSHSDAPLEEDKILYTLKKLFLPSHDIKKVHLSNIWLPYSSLSFNPACIPNTAQERSSVAKQPHEKHPWTTWMLQSLTLAIWRWEKKKKKKKNRWASEL